MKKIQILSDRNEDVVLVVEPFGDRYILTAGGAAHIYRSDGGELNIHNDLFEMTLFSSNSIGVWVKESVLVVDENGDPLSREAV